MVAIANAVSHQPSAMPMDDLRLAVRSLRVTPVVSFVAALSLALGIGANSAIFSLVNSLLLRALPVKEPRQLALVTDNVAGGVEAWTNPIWEQMRDRRDLFDTSFAWSTQRFNLAAGGETQFVDGIWASGGMFETLGVPAMLGRTFREADDRHGGAARDSAAAAHRDAAVRLAAERSRQIPERSVHAGGGSDRQLANAAPLPAAADDHPGRRRARAADCVRQHREPSSRAHGGAAARVERPPGTRRVALAAHAAVAGGEPAAGGSRRRGGPVDRAVGQPPARAAAL